MNDPILEELWHIKEGMAKACGYDMRTLFERLKAAQQSHPDRIVNLRTRKREPDLYFHHVAEKPASYMN